LLFVVMAVIVMRVRSRHHLSEEQGDHSDYHDPTTEHAVTLEGDFPTNDGRAHSVTE
jgi:hypothetical protein